MKYATLFFGFVLVLAVPSCAPQATEMDEAATATEPVPIVGAWELIYGKYGLPDNPTERNQPDRPFQIKLFTDDGHFALLMKSEADSFSAASAGIYRLEGDVYTETHQWAADPSWRGNTIDWRYRVEGDTLYMAGPLRAWDALGEEVEVTETLEETRVRAKPVE